MKYLRSRSWAVISVVSLILAIVCLWLSRRWDERRSAATNPTEQVEAKVGSTATGSIALTKIVGEALAKKAVGEIPSRLQHRLSNTSAGIRSLMRNDRAILLENALIDTSISDALAIPESLRLKGAPGSYIVQARGYTSDAFRSSLEQAGAKIVSYVPNNAYLVRASEEVASALGADPAVASVVPYQPYFKLEPGLLGEVLQPTVQPGTAQLKVTIYAGDDAAAKDAIHTLGFEVSQSERSPFGELLTVKGPSQAIAALAQEPTVQAIENAPERMLLTDLARVRVGVSSNSFVPGNWLGLTGSNVVIGLNDTGVQASHPDLTGRVIDSGFLDARGGSILSDYDGHGTHVAGIMITTGASFPGGTNALGSLTNANYRGMAPGASVYPLPVDPISGSFRTDTFLQEATARTNIFISNNSWGYRGSRDYTSSSASFDAATRDSLPEKPGSQGVLYVFAAGDGGNGSASGSTGVPDTIISPATAKNVIAVGALDQLREITNSVAINGVTNDFFFAETDSDYQVSPFSSRGNTGIGVEGEFGRYKPDLVAPGSFMVSTRATNYAEPTGFPSYRFSETTGQHLEPGQTNVYAVTIPANGKEISISTLPLAQSGPVVFPLQIAAGSSNPPLQVRGTNQVLLQVPADIAPGLVFYSVVNTNAVGISFDVRTAVTLESESGDYYDVLAQLNAPLGPYYRYDSGTSMSAPVVSGMLALVQEFFETRLGRTNSPAMMKALLINGARRSSVFYDFNPGGLVNHQGWGVPQLTNTLPAILESAPESTWPVRLFDQSPTNALATGEQFSRTITPSEEAKAVPLRITLVWTDPPGNPIVGAKLVNDLDLVVTNMATGAAIFGNNFPSGSQYTVESPKGLDESDLINNVENVYLPAPLASNYVVTVRGKRVNVNAVTGQTNGTKQDFALVISSGDTALTSPFGLSGIPALTTQAAPLVLTISNSIALTGQRVGANAPLGSRGPGGGVANQWRFYRFTNDIAGATNVGFVTFFPPNLSKERANGEADIDLYVSQNPGLTNLNPAALAGSWKSLQRGGTEVITTNNSQKGDVYYIGVKSEDQQASDFNLFAVASIDPFSRRDAEGNLILNGFPRLAALPDGTSDNPGIRFIVFPAFGERDIIRRVVVTNEFYHENFGDLFGNLSHERKFSVLNNHSFNLNNTPGFRRIIYDDSNSGEIFGAIPPDGPGDLRGFWGLQAGQPWIFTVVDNSLNHTGRLDRATIKIYPQLVNTNVIKVTILPNRWYYDLIDVPPEADRLNLIVSYDGNAPGPVDTYLRAEHPPTAADYDKYVNIVPPGGTNSISRGDIPPLRPATYYAGLFNPNPFPISVTYRFSLDLLLGGLFTPNPGMTNSTALLDDALTKSVLTVTNQGRIVGMQMGLKVQHPRLSDLSFSLVSPSGVRSLLMENRGQGSSGFAGVFTEGTNAMEVARFAGVEGFTLLPTTNYLVLSDFEDSAVGTVTAPGQVAPWNILANSVTVVSNVALRYSGSNVLALADGVIRTNLATVPGTTYSLTMGVRDEPLAAWWPVDDNTWKDPIGTNTGNFIAGSYGPGEVGAAAVFNGSSYVQVPYSPRLDVGATNGFTIEGWVRLANTNSVMPLVRYLNGANFAEGVGLVLNSDGQSFAPGRVALYMVGTNGVTQTNATLNAVLGTNVWQHLAWTFDIGSGESRLYVDGALVLSHNFGVVRPETRLDLFIGGRGAGGFVGSLDELAIFGTALADSEVGAIYRAGALGRDGLVGAPSVTFGAVTKPFRSMTNGWSEFRYDFLAVSDQTSLTLTGSAWCPLVDRIAFFSVTNAEIPIYGVPSGNTNAMLGVVKFASFPITNGLMGSTSVVATALSSDFDRIPINRYAAGETFGGWLVISGDVDVFDPAVSGGRSFSPPNLMDINGSLAGAISRPLALKPGTDYRLSFAFTKSPTANTPTANVSIGLQTWLVADNKANSWRSLMWSQTSVVFTATANSTDLTLRGTGSTPPFFSGILFDSILLEELGEVRPAYLLPEEPLDVFKGEEAQGDWTLEITDSRTGGLVGAGNPSLLEWNLQFIFAPPNVTAMALTNGYLSTNIVRGAETTYFTIDVPAFAGFATNILESVSGGQLNLLFNQNVRPTGTAAGDIYLQTATTGGTNVLAVNGTPPLVPGRRYYLGVQNADPGTTNTFTMQVFFDRLVGIPGNVMVLTNGFTFATNTVPGVGIQYYAFDVSTNATGAAFEILRPGGDVNLVVRGALPLPTSSTYDYLSANPGTNYEYISVLTNSPVAPLKPGRWYLGVYHAGFTNYPYGVRVTEEYYFDTNSPSFPVTEIFADTPVNLVVTPGAVVTNFYRLHIAAGGGAALWELYNLAGDADLLLARDYPPSMARYDYISRAFATNREQVIVETDFLNPILAGDWYVALPSNATNDIGATLRTTVSTNGFLPGAGQIVTNILSDGIAVTIFTVGPGIVVSNYFLFPVTGNPAGLLIEVYNADGDVDLVVGQDGIPSATFNYTSARFGLAAERLLARTNAALANFSVYLPNVSGNWLIATPNRQGANVTFTIRATQANAAGLILPNEPLELTAGMFDPVFGSLDLAVPTVPGENYQLQSSTDLVMWTTLQTFQASDYSSSVTVFPPMIGAEFYRIVQVP
jgi:subtilisin-like proprotein convertase family protein